MTTATNLTDASIAPMDSTPTIIMTPAFALQDLLSVHWDSVSCAILTTAKDAMFPTFALLVSQPLFSIMEYAYALLLLDLTSSKASVCSATVVLSSAIKRVPA